MTKERKIILSKLLKEYSNQLSKKRLSQTVNSTPVIAKLILSIGVVSLKVWYEVQYDNTDKNKEISKAIYIELLPSWDDPKVYYEIVLSIINFINKNFGSKLNITAQYVRTMGNIMVRDKDPYQDLSENINQQTANNIAQALDDWKPVITSFKFV